MTLWCQYYCYHNSLIITEKFRDVDTSFDQTLWTFFFHNKSFHKNFAIRSYLPTPPLGQDMTQGQFLSGV